MNGLNNKLRPFVAALVLAAGLSTGLAAPAFAQEPAPAFAVAQQPPADDTFVPLAPEQLDTLLGPIALYPDPLIAQILPASTYPIDIVKAARFARTGAPADQIDQQPWDPSVRAVAHYPNIIEMMDQSIDWTQQLGQAFIARPDDVMQSIQRLRVQAQNVGNLVTTPQEQVLVEDSAVRILPADPNIVYVPTYDPAVVYYQAPTYGPYVTFGFGFPCGDWLDLDFDWANHWCYRPGWTWNHWHDNFIVDRGRFIRPSHDFEPHRGGPPSTAWHRDSAKPLTFSGRRLTSPAAFDRFRGRDDSQHRPSVAPVPRPTNVDRGRGPEQHQPSGIVVPNRNGDNTSRSLDRGQSSRRSEAPHAAPAPAPIHAAAPPRAAEPPRAPAPAQRVNPAPAPIQRATPAPAPRPAAPARVNPAPVRIAPPPAAASRPSPPAYVRPSQPQTQQGQNNNNENRGGHR